MRSATLKDVAAMAGVSVSTASRVLNDNYPVSAEVRERVLEVIKALAYTPNSAARSLKTQKTDMIGLVVADIGSPFFVGIAKGIESTVMQEGYNILIAGSNGDVEKERQLLSALLEKRVAALIVASADSSGQALQPFVNAHIPVILVDRFLPDIKADCVLEKNFEIARELTRILIQHGHRDIAIVNVLLSVSSGLARYEGFMAAHKEAGLKPVSRNISGSNFTQEDARAWTYRLFSGERPPTAIFCANNVMVAGALQALGELSLRVPQDVSVVSFGELDMQALIDTKITSSVQDSFAMGVIAGRLALERITHGNGKPPMQEHMEMAIAVRSSVATP